MDWVGEKHRVAERSCLWVRREGKVWGGQEEGRERERQGGVRHGRGSWGEGQEREARAREGMRVRVGKGRQVREGAEEGRRGAGKGVKGG